MTFYGDLSRKTSVGGRWQPFVVHTVQAFSKYAVTLFQGNRSTFHNLYRL